MTAGTAHAPLPEDPLARFLHSLGAEGRAVVDPSAPPAAGPAVIHLLSELESAAREELASPPPPISMPSAAWALRLLYEGCRFVVCRDVGEPEVVASLKAPCPEARSHSVDWSVDLLFRHLPDLVAKARHLNKADPLVRELQFLAVSWPLSSVGVPGLTGTPLDLDPFLGHPALRQLYVDRILRTQDLSRLGHPVVDEGLRTAIGAHPELAPEIARGL
ncbi:MAG TPA: hypothetical protein DCM86_01965 [Verrucomicrobiales bacterium]|nr:hypothetical protein [Verrucomicrobiales bacterium]